MKTEHKILIFSIFFGLLALVAEGLLHYATFPHSASFVRVLLTDQHLTEPYVRILVFGCFIIFGVVTSRLIANQRRVQESSAAREDKLAGILRKVGEAVITTDAEGKVEFFNPLAGELTGWTADDAMGQTPAEVFRLVHQSDKQPIPDLVLPVLTEGLAVDLADDAVLITKDGTARPVGGNATPLRDPQGNIRGVVFAFRDVTEQRRLQNRLRREKETAEQLLEISGVIIIALDSSGRITHINKKGCEVLAGQAEDLIGRDWFGDFLPDKVRTQAHDVFGQLMAGETTPDEHFENSICTLDGRERLIAWHNMVLTDHRGRITGTLSSGEDITERRQALDALRESEERFRAVFTTAVDCIFIKDRQLRYTQVNPSMEAVYGKTAAEMVGQTDEEIFGEKTADCWLESDQRVLAGETIEEEVTRSINGVPTAFHVIKVPLTEKDGTIIGLCGYARNFTSRKQSERALRESEARLNRQYTTLAQLGMRRILLRGDLPTALRQITEAAAETLEVKRVSVWLYDDRQTLIRCHDLYEATKQTHSSGLELKKDDYPNYFAALEENRAIAVENALVDQRTSEFAATYLNPLGITSMLDAPIRLGNHVAGVICHEHIGPPRRWTLDEQNFAGSMADSVALALEISERGRTEAALKENEEKYRALVETTDTGYLIIDELGCVLDANPEYVRLTGHQTLEEIKGRSVVEWTAPHDLERNAREVEKCRRLGFVKNLELDYIDKNDRITSIEVNAKVVQTEDGIKILTLCRDITERKQDERVQRLTKFSVDRASDAIFWMGSDARFLSVNDTTCRALGYSREELLSMTVHEIDPDFPTEVWSQHWEELKRRKKITIESRHRTKDGRVFPVEINVNYLEFDGREYNCAIARDITDRKQVEKTTSEQSQQAVDRAHRLLEEIFRESLDVLLVVDGEGIIRRASKVIKDLLGYPANEIIGQPFSRLLPPKTKKTPAEILDRLRVYNGVFTEQRIRRADGSICIMEMTATAIPWRDGKAILTTLRDSSQHYWAEKSVIETEGRYRRLYEEAPLGYQTLDEFGDILAMNGVWRKVLGYSGEEIIGSNFRALLAESALPIFEQNFPPQPTGGDVEYLELNIRKKDGIEIVVRFACRNVFDEKGNFRQAHWIMQDVQPAGPKTKSKLKNSKTTSRRAGIAGT